MTFDEIAPYLSRPRQFDRQLLTKIAGFLERLGYGSVQQWDSEFSNYGSSLGVTIRCSEDWHTQDVAANHDAPYTMILRISARGPFITSGGWKVVPTPADMYRPPGQDRGVSMPNDAAEQRALDLANAVAQEFNLTYLEREWLRRFKLAEESLTADALLSVDFSEHDALNVLFDEFA
jgi:hypothetical protein